MGAPVHHMTGCDLQDFGKPKDLVEHRKIAPHLLGAVCDRFCNEQEVIILPGSKFKVVKVVRPMVDKPDKASYVVLAPWGTDTTNPDAIALIELAVNAFKAKKGSKAPVILNTTFKEYVKGRCNYTDGDHEGPHKRIRTCFEWESVRYRSDIPTLNELKTAVDTGDPWKRYDFRRQQHIQQQYGRDRVGILEEYKTVGDKIKVEILNYPDISFRIQDGTDRRIAGVADPKTTLPHKLTKNKYPYMLGDSWRGRSKSCGCGHKRFCLKRGSKDGGFKCGQWETLCHYVLWAQKKMTIAEVKEKALKELHEQGYCLNNELQSTHTDTADCERSGKDICWRDLSKGPHELTDAKIVVWENPAHMKSIPGAWHAHIVFKEPKVVYERTRRRRLGMERLLAELKRCQAQS